VWVDGACGCVGVCGLLATSADTAAMWAKLISEVRMGCVTVWMCGCMRVWMAAEA